MKFSGLVHKKSDVNCEGLTPEEYFVLSRFDGSIKIETLIKLSGLNINRAEFIVETLIEKGILILDDNKSEENLNDDIERMKDLLSKTPNYYELLGLNRDATTEEIKAQFHSLSKKYHPDRYRINGEKREEIVAIYKCITEAYQVLINSETRREYDRSLDKNKDSLTENSSAQSRELDRIREYVKRSKVLFEEGMKAFYEKKVYTAISKVKLAIMYDPENKEYKMALEEILKSEREQRMKLILRKADTLLELDQIDNAEVLVDDLLSEQPLSTSANYIKALICYKKGDNLKAKEYLLKSIEVDNHNVKAHFLLGNVFRDAGLKSNAIRELNYVIERLLKSGSDKDILEEARNMIFELKGVK